MSYSSHKTLYALWLQSAQQQMQAQRQDELIRRQEEIRQEQVQWDRKQQLLQNARQMNQDAENIRNQGFERKMKMAQLQGQQAATAGKAAPTYTDSRYDQYSAMGYEGAMSQQRLEEQKLARQKELEQYEQEQWLAARQGQLDYKDWIARQEEARRQAVLEDYLRRGLELMPGGGLVDREDRQAHEMAIEQEKNKRPRSRGSSRSRDLLKPRTLEEAIVYEAMNFTAGSYESRIAAMQEYARMRNIGPQTQQFLAKMIARQSGKKSSKQSPGYQKYKERREQRK